MHEVYAGVSRTAFLASVQWWNKKLRPVVERHIDSNAMMLFMGMGSHFHNYFVLCGSIFFVYVPNELYLHWLSVDFKYVDLCDTL